MSLSRTSRAAILASLLVFGPAFAQTSAGETGSVVETPEPAPASHVFDAPPAVLRVKGNAEWRLWYSVFGTMGEGRYGTPHIDGKEAFGMTKGEGISCDLGDFEWQGAYADRRTARDDSGWFPTGSGLKFTRDENLSVLTKRMAIFRRRPDFMLRDDRTLWLQWSFEDTAAGERFGRETLARAVRGSYGVLRVDGRWLDDNGDTGEHLATGIGEFVLAGPFAVADGPHGWVLPGPTSRESLIALVRASEATAEDVRALLRLGANPNAVDREGGSVLMHAVTRRNWLFNPGGETLPEGDGPDPVVETLLAAGADPNAVDGRGRTVLMRAAAFADRPGTITALIKAGAAVDARGDGGRTALMYAAGVAPSPAFLEPLLQAGADVDAAGADASGSLLTPLIAAAEHNDNPAIVSALLRAGADMAAANKQGQFAMTASQRNPNRKEVLEILQNAWNTVPEKRRLELSVGQAGMLLENASRLGESRDSAKAMLDEISRSRLPRGGRPPEVAGVFAQAAREVPPRDAGAEPGDAPDELVPRTPVMPWPPQLTLRRGAAEWQRWHSSGTRLGAHAKLFVDNKEEVGETEGTRIDSDLGAFMWMGQYDSSDLPRSVSGWKPIDDLSQHFPHDTYERQDVDALVWRRPDRYVARGDDQWFMWHLDRDDGSAGAYGALCLGGKWLMGKKVGERREIFGQTLVWHGPYVPKPTKGFFGWIPAG